MHQMQAKNMASLTLSSSILRISTKFLNGNGRHIRPITKRVETKEEEEEDASLSDFSDEKRGNRQSEPVRREEYSNEWKEGERYSGVLFFSSASFET